MAKLNKKFIRYLQEISESELKKILKICTKKEKATIKHALSKRIFTVDEILDLWEVDDKTILNKTACMLNANEFKFDSKMNCFVLETTSKDYYFNISKFKDATKYEFDEEMEEYTGIKYYYANSKLDTVIQKKLPDKSNFTAETFANYIGIEYKGLDTLTMAELLNPNVLTFEISLTSAIPILNNQESRIVTNLIYLTKKKATATLKDLYYDDTNNVFIAKIESFYGTDYDETLKVVLTFLKEEYLKMTFHNVHELKTESLTSYPMFNGSLHDLYNKKLNNHLVVSKFDIFQLINFYILCDGKLNIYSTHKWYKVKKNNPLEEEYVTARYIIRKEK